VVKRQPAERTAVVVKSFGSALSHDASVAPTIAACEDKEPTALHSTSLCLSLPRHHETLVMQSTDPRNISLRKAIVGE